MICQSCNKNKATTHIKTIIDGNLKEYMLCSECAEKLGYSNPLDLFDFSFGNFLSSVFGNSTATGGALQSGNVLRCKQCGSSIDEISKNGKVGCANCYETFKSDLLPLIERIHGNTTHVGKIPSSAGEHVKIKNNIKNLKQELKEAINKQEFERAAVLRDEIKNLESQVN